MRVSIWVFLCCLLQNYADARVFPTLEQAERQCIQPSNLRETSYYKWQCRLQRGAQNHRCHFVHFDRARVHCIKRVDSGGFICIAVKPVGVEPLIRDASDMDLDLDSE